MNNLSSDNSSKSSRIFSRFLPKSLLLAALLCPVVPVQATSAKGSDTLSNIAGATVVATVAYAGSWMYAYCLYNCASSRFELPIAVVAAYADNPNDHGSLYQELLGLINIDNATWSLPSSRYHNYPLVEFVVHLDASIRKLSISSWLTMPTPLSSDMHLLKQQLQRVKYYCVRHQAYIDQRRHADELAAHPAKHVVVH